MKKKGKENAVIDLMDAEDDKMGSVAGMGCTKRKRNANEIITIDE